MLKEPAAVLVYLREIDRKTRVGFGETAVHMPMPNRCIVPLINIDVGLIKHGGLIRGSGWSYDPTIDPPAIHHQPTGRDQNGEGEGDKQSTITSPTATENSMCAAVVVDAPGAAEHSCIVL